MHNNSMVHFYPFYSRATSAASLEWLKFLKTKEIPVIVCITHGDVLYFEEEDRRKSGNVRKERNEIVEEVRREIGSEIYVSFMVIHGFTLLLLRAYL